MMNDRVVLAGEPFPSPPTPRSMSVDSTDTGVESNLETETVADTGTEVDTDTETGTGTEVDTDHLEDVPDGCGCAEVWEHTSEARED